MPHIHGDFSLNVANSQAAAAFLELGVRRLTPTFDLDALQLCEIAAALPPALRRKLEVVVHANVPIFHTEHCVFAQSLSDGNSYKDCGHPCKRHALHLVDEQQQRHHVLADSGCRNTVFNAQPQSAAPYLGALRDAGVANLRVELTVANPNPNPNPDPDPNPNPDPNPDPAQVLAPLPPHGACGVGVPVR